LFNLPADDGQIDLTQLEDETNADAEEDTNSDETTSKTSVELNADAGKSDVELDTFAGGIMWAPDEENINAV